MGFSHQQNENRQLLRRQIRAWLKSGVWDQGQWFATTTGTSQGGVLSPLLANIALHGMETRIKQAFPKTWNAQMKGHIQPPHLIRYADDLVGATRCRML